MKKMTDSETNAMVIVIFEYLSRTRKMMEKEDDIMGEIMVLNRIDVCKDLIKIGKRFNIESIIDYKPFWIKK
jgi:hypothetical protein